MDKNQKYTFYIVGVCLALVIGISVSFITHASSELQAAQNKIADLERRLAITGDASDASLADAIVLLPADLNVIGGTRVSSREFIINTDTDTTPVHTIQTWAVDVESNIASLIQKRNFENEEITTSIDTSSVSEAYATVETQVTTTGTIATYMDIVDIRTGELLASTSWENGSHITVQKNDKILSMSVSADACRTSKIFIDGIATTIPKTAKGICSNPANFGIPLYSKSIESNMEIVDFETPWGGTMTVHLNNLHPTGVTFE